MSSSFAPPRVWRQPVGAVRIRTSLSELCRLSLSLLRLYKDLEKQKFSKISKGERFTNVDVLIVLARSWRKHKQREFAAAHVAQADHEAILLQVNGRMVDVAVLVQKLWITKV